MLKVVKEVAPETFKNAGASCITYGYCPEGNMSCGAFPTLDKLTKN
jgi:thymidylate synthase (FAD)